ncbi:MAG: FRG domain-containing protein, partial [Flavobacterium sp.]
MYLYTDIATLLIMALSNIQVLEVDDWNNIQDQLNKFSHWPGYVFRGQANATWLLEPTLSRVLKLIKEENMNELIRTHLHNFRLDIRGRRGNNPRPLSDNDLWALGQHYGLYTPLLDWTKSPWVALYFSLVYPEEKDGNKRVLWALHTPDIENINIALTSKSKDKSFRVELIEPTIDDNSRLVNQNGLFTKVNYENDIEKWVSEGPDVGNWITLYKIIFPDSLRQRLLLSLNLMNIN